MIAFALARFGMVSAAAALAAISVAPPSPRSASRIAADMDDLVAAYPTALAGHDGKMVLWRKGPSTQIGDPAAKRGAEAILADPEIADIFAWTYPLSPAAARLGDPGRARPGAFFTRLYGDCRKGGVDGSLAQVRWVDGRTIRFTKTAGAADALAAVARDLEKLGPKVTALLWPISGTYNCRTIAGTKDLSMHAYGAAIDLDSRFGGYWRWGPRPTGRKLPAGVIETFERHGFIWGGKWAHFDSFHFEYRPELIRAARRAE